MNRKHRNVTRRDGRHTPLFVVFRNMHIRCGADYKEAHRYHGRGIAVDPRWSLKNWDAFADWAQENGYATGLYLDRRDNNTGYSPENCRFVTPAGSAKNRENVEALIERAAAKRRLPVRRLDTNFIYESVVAAARGLKINYTNLRRALARGHKVRGVEVAYV